MPLGIYQVQVFEEHLFPIGVLSTYVTDVRCTTCTCMKTVVFISISVLVYSANGYVGLTKQVTHHAAGLSK